MQPVYKVRCLINMHIAHEAITDPIMAKRLERGDSIVVETERGYQIATVVEVNEQECICDAESNETYNESYWVIDKVDLAEYWKRRICGI